ncbi:MAG: sulfotransferase domain-containing protein, partial [Phycisphaerae bacterium]|nr:sulfotransferase domain-containing protein [Phycisphaerae bacterium]
EQGLDTNGRVMICSYEDLVAKPAACVKRLYDFIGHKFPGEKILPSIYQESAGQGGDVELSEEIQRLCSDLLGRINACRDGSTG